MSKKQSEYFNMESFFDEFMACIKGRRVDEILSSKVGFANADYQINDANCLIELKTLETNQAEESVFIKKLASLNKLPFEKTLTFDNNNHSVPDDLFKQFLGSIEDAIYPRIKKVITKANKQIRETKFNLGLDSHFGIVWIVNERSILLEPNVLKNLVVKALDTNSLSSIQAVIISNVNLHVTTSEKENRHLYWVPIFKIDKDKEEVDEVIWDIVHTIGLAWNVHVRKHFKIPIKFKTISGNEVKMTDFYNLIENKEYQ
jgi:hypothetical protein